MSEEHKITSGTISGANFVSVDIEPSIIVDRKSYTASEFNKAVEMLKQPQLNKNQQQVLGGLKVGHCDGDSVFEALERITDVYEDPKTEEALESLSPDQEVQVISSFMKWTLEQEEE